MRSVGGEVVGMPPTTALKQPLLIIVLFYAESPLAVHKCPQRCAAHFPRVDHGQLL